MVRRASAVGCRPLRKAPPCEGGGRLAGAAAVLSTPAAGPTRSCFTIMQDLILARVKQRDGAADDRRTTVRRAVKHTSARPEAPADCSDQSFSEVSALLSPIARRFPF